MPTIPNSISSAVHAAFPFSPTSRAHSTLPDSHGSAPKLHGEPLGAFALPPTPLAPASDPLPPILVADDDEDDTFFIERLIKKTGMQNPIRTFDDGTEVVNFLGGARLSGAAGRVRCPRLLFLDLKMRGLGGFGFLEWARQQKDLGPLTIVVLSNTNESEAVARAFALGAHRYLVKYPCAQTINTIVRSVYPQTVY